jgi:hypothetical protein
MPAMQIQRRKVRFVLLLSVAGLSMSHGTFSVQNILGQW